MSQLAHRLLDRYYRDVPHPYRRFELRIDELVAGGGQVLLDAGYFDDSVIPATLERDVSLICPEGKTPGTPSSTI